MAAPSAATALDMDANSCVLPPSRIAPVRDPASKTLKPLTRRPALAEARVKHSTGETSRPRISLSRYEPRLRGEVLFGRLPVQKKRPPASRHPAPVALRLDREEVMRPERDVVHVADPGKLHIMENIETVSMQAVEGASDLPLRLSARDPSSPGLANPLPARCFMPSSLNIAAKSPAAFQKETRLAPSLRAFSPAARFFRSSASRKARSFRGGLSR